MPSAATRPRSPTSIPERSGTEAKPDGSARLALEGQGGETISDHTAAAVKAAGAPRRFRAGGPPADPTSAATVALTVAAFVILASWGTLRDVRAALATLEAGGILADIVLVLLGVAALFPALPAL